MFNFAWPFMFLLLPVYFLVLKFIPQKARRNESMLRIPFLARIQELPKHSAANYVVSSSFKSFLGFVIWSLLIVACANPQWLGNPVPVKQEGRNIMLAVDLSQSMEIPDLQRDDQTITRLDTVKGVASNFIEKRHGDKLGLILFGSKAYLQTPLTFDRKTVGNMLDDATIGLAGGRTAIGDAIGLAVKKFSNEDTKSRIVILLTDGANNSGQIDPIEAAELAKDNKIKVYTIGIGASEMVVSGVFGKQLVNPSADLDEGLLKKISEMTQGQYFRAQDDQTLASIMESINQLEPINTDANKARPITALFYWPLAVALLFLSILFFPNKQELTL